MKRACSSPDFAYRSLITQQLSLTPKLRGVPLPAGKRATTGLWKDNSARIRLYLSVLAILLVSSYTNTCSAQIVDSNKVVNSLNRCWRAFSHEYAAIYGLEEEEIKRYSKQRVCFTRDSVSLYYGVTYAPRYSIKKVGAEDYARTNFDVDKQKMGVTADSVFEITISSVSKPLKDGTVRKMTDIIAFDGTCTYIVVDGVIFKLVDADSRVQPRSSN